VTDLIKENEHLRKIVKGLTALVMAGMFVQLAVIGYVAFRFYHSGRELVYSARAGCGRTILDRNSILTLNLALQEGFRDTDKRFVGPISPERINAEKALERDLPALLVRAQIDCQEAFP